MKSHKVITGISVFIIMMFVYSIQFAQNLLNGPEAVVKDPFNGDYMVVNATDGKVIRVAQDWTQSEFITGLNTPIGAVVVDSTLFVTNNSPNMIKGFNLFTGEKTFEITLPAVTLANLTFDGNLYLYVVDQSGKVFKVNSKTGAFNVFVSSGLTNSLQGIVYDAANNRLIAVAFPNNSSIYSISILDSTVSVMQTTTIGKFTSAAIDSSGNIYASSGRTNSVYKFDATFSIPPIVISNGHNSPTGICLDYQNSRLIISNYGSNIIDTIPISLTNVDETETLAPAVFELSQNYPNPFNPSTVISFKLSVKSMIQLKIYDLLGREVATLVNEEKPAGTHSLKFSAGDGDNSSITSGIYFYKITSGSFTQTKKMVLLR
ncbi:MAG: T9SS type A sorting domain-containing protein [bacterium]